LAAFISLSIQKYLPVVSQAPAAYCTAFIGSMCLKNFLNTKVILLTGLPQKI
jgi:hypothetical protein